MRGSDHPHDASLIARHFDPSDTNERLERHLSTCARCTARQREIVTALGGDAHWGHRPSPRLAETYLERQRHRIQGRLQPATAARARVIAFPRRESEARSSRPVFPMRSRLAAAATILALVGAAGAGWVIEAQRHRGPHLQAVAHRPAAPVVRPAQLSQDALLGDIDMALASPQTPALRALDALTAGAADAPRGR
jgi:hypothetical protein